MSEKIRVLIAEDLPSDAELCMREIRKVLESCEFRRVEIREDYISSLKEFGPALVISDYKMPRFDGMTALRLAQQHDPDLPFILVTGSASEQIAVECMKAGAWDYVIKGHIKRLGPAALAALEEKRLRIEKRQSENKLRQSEERYRVLFENAGQSIAVVQGGKIKFGNPKLEQTTGYTISELAGMDAFKLIHPDDREMVINYTLSRQRGEPVPSQYQLRYFNKAGESRWLERKITDITWEREKAALVLDTDITDGKQAEEKLAESEERYRSLVERANDGICIIQDSVIKYCNLHLAEMWGGNVQEMVGTSFLNFVHADSLEKVSNSYMRRMAGEDLPTAYEVMLKRKDGTKLDAEINSGVLSYQGKQANMVIIRDITERKKSEHELRDSVERFKQVAEVAEEFIWEVDEKGVYSYCSPVVERILGYSAGELVGQKHFYDLFAPEVRAELRKQALAAFERKQSILNFVNPNIHKNGSRIYLETNGLPILDEKGNLLGYRGIDKDITGRRKAEEELTASELRFRELFQNMSSGVVVYGAVAGGEDFIIKDFNSAAEKIEKIKKEDLIGKSVLEVFPGVKEFGIFDVFQRVGRSGKAEYFPVAYYLDDRISGWRENYVYKLPSGEIVAVYDDVTENKQAEEALAKEAIRRRILIEQSRDGIVILDNDGAVYEVNQRFADMLGYSLEEARLLHVWDWEYLYSPEQTTDMIRKVDEKGDHFETKHLRKDGTVYDVEISTNAALFGREKLIFCVCRDITQRKKDAEQIARSKALLQTVIDSTPDRIAVKDSQHRYLLVNRSFADLLNLRPQEMVGKLDADFFSQEQILGNASKGTRSIHDDDDLALTGQIVREISSIIDKSGKPEIFDAYRVPLKDSHDNIYGILSYNRDITELYNATENLKKSYEKVQKVLDETVEAIATICETRDPYTAGHQNRTSQLACAIALEMGINKEVVSNIKTGATLHDVGKLYVPAEILSKPGKLTEIEFAIIRNHPQVGYDIVKKIEFPCTVAKVILQHHERLNGSGYPNGLTTGDITIEAKIMAVADVVEAMSSHRPYRPALGIEKALDEINRNKGTLYDEKVVDICTRLFNEKQFKFD